MSGAGPVLVVGATGILRPAVDVLRAEGTAVRALARPGDRLASLVAATGADPVPADLTDPAGVDRALRGLPPLAAALVYAPAAQQEVRDRLLAASPRPVLLMTSAAADPAGTTGPVDPDRLGPALPAGGRRLLLGWTGQPGASRWHTPPEVSAAALDVLRTGRSAVLGRVRPWGDRPA